MSHGEPDSRTSYFDEDIWTLEDIVDYTRSEEENQGSAEERPPLYIYSFKKTE